VWAGRKSGQASVAKRKPTALVAHDDEVGLLEGRKSLLRLGELEPRLEQVAQHDEM
jgi:hypothetical protein